MKVLTKRLATVLPLLFLVPLALLTACGGSGEAEMAQEQAVQQISGTVIYRERMMLKPGAELEVQLLDVSVADTLGTVMATVTMTPEGGPPFPFSIDYQPAQIKDGLSYAVRATIRRDEQLEFTSTEYIDPFAPGPLEILVSRVPAPEPVTPLRGTTWLLQTIEGEEAATPQGKPIDLLFDAQEMRVSGFSGCNRYMGPFELPGSTVEGAMLSFGNLAGTLMACPDDNGLERRYLQALGGITSYQLSDGQLVLTQGGTAVLTYKAGP